MNLRPALLAASIALATAGTRAENCPGLLPGFARPHLTDTALALATHDDGSGNALWVGGQQFHVLRWDGRAWIEPGSGLAGTVHALAEFGQGPVRDLYAGGEFYDDQVPSAPRFIARWNGSSWLTLPGSIDNTVNALVEHDDGHGPELFAGGQFTTIAGQPAARIAAWNGSSWRTLGTGLDGIVHALAVHDDGTGPKLFAGGFFSLAGGVAAANVARWDGTSWSPLSNGVSGTVYALASFQTRLYAGGDFTNASGTPANRIAAWNGNLWSAVGSGTNDVVRALRVLDDAGGPRLFVCGDFTDAGGTGARGVARWMGSGWLGTGSLFTGQAFAVAAYDDGSGSKVFAAGNCTLATNTSVLRLLRWDGVDWSAVSQGATYGSVASVEVFDDGSGPEVLVAGGIGDLGGSAVPNLVRWDGAGWSVPSNVPDFHFEQIRVLDDGSGAALYCSGRLDGGPFAPHSVARYRAGTWEPLGGDLHLFWADLEMFDFGSGPQLVLATGDDDDPILRWDGAQWTLLGGTAYTTFDLTVFDDGSGPALYSSGYSTASVSSPKRVARWNGSDWVVVGLFNGEINELQALDDGTGTALYVGGDFTTMVGGVNGSRIVKWDGTQWSIVGGGLSDRVSALASFDDGMGNGTRLHAATLGTGDFWRLDGATWTNLGDAADPDGVNELQPVRLPGQHAQLWFATEGIGQMGGVEMSRVGVYEACAQVGDLFCFGDGVAAACPCGNVSQTAEQAGCRNSTGLGGRVRASGHPSLAHDSLLLTGGGMPESFALYYQGLTVTSPIQFGDGLRCVGGPFLRLGAELNSAGASQHPGPEDPSISVRGQVGAPGTRCYAVWYRNPATYCTSATFNYTNAVTIRWES